MKKLKFLIALPDSIYFLWQMLVQINNFEKWGYLEDTIYLIGVSDLDNINPKLLKLKKETKAEIHFYKDDRIIKKHAYPSALRPNIIKKYFKEHQKSSNIYFYLDPDLIFTKKFNFTPLLHDNYWYVSDTRSYIDSNYIISKSEKLFNEMCEIVDINPQLVIDNDKNAGGAQYLMKNVDWKFWEEVEFASGQLYDWMKSTESIYHPEHPIQSWTADMWAVLWVAWKRGHKTKIIDTFNFTWATEHIGNWDQNFMFHNAGVSTQDYLFNKGTYANKHPFNDDFSYVSEKYASYNYVNEIKETGKKYKKIIE